MRKSTRLSAIGLVQAPEPKKPFSTRFSLRSFAKRVQLLTPEQRSAISRTGFGNLLSVPNHCLNKVFLTELMEAWSSGSRAFVLRSGGEIRMTLLDAALILGLPVIGNPVNLTEQEPFSDLEESYGATKVKRKVAMSFLENRLDSIGDAASDDFVRSFLLYTIGTFLASNDGKVDSQFLRFLGDLGEVSGFAWGAAVIDDLCQWLDKRKEQNVKYVGGCLIFLQTWSYEHFDVAARPQLQDHDVTFPRMCRWDNIKSNQRQQGTSWFKELDDDQVIWKLQPTSGELQIEIIKEALELIGDNKELRSAESRSTCTPSSVSDVDSGFRHSINGEVCREDEDNMENQVVEDTPTRSSTSHEKCRKQINLGNLVVLDTPPNLIICDKVRGEQEMDPENRVVVVEGSPTTISIPDEVGGHKVMVVEDTPPDLTICDKVRREQEMNLENLVLVVEDTPPTMSFSDELGGDQEFKCEKLFVEDSPPKLSFYDQDDIRQKNVTLQEENAELKKELDLLREENRILRLSLSSFLDRMDGHILDFESNTTN